MCAQVEKEVGQDVHRTKQYKCLTYSNPEVLVLRGATSKRSPNQVEPNYVLQQVVEVDKLHHNLDIQGSIEFPFFALYC